MTTKKSKSAKAAAGKKLGLEKKTLKNLSTRDSSVRGGRRRIATESCIIQATCTIL
jgi:hypothetical protein